MNLAAVLKRGMPVRAQLLVNRLRRPVDEMAVISAVLSAPNGLIVDVGAHYGESLEPFVERGWRAVAFEPDPANRAVLLQKWGAESRVRVDSRAVSNVSQAEASFFTSSASSGISALSPFHATHRASDLVQVTTLGEALTLQESSDVELLKVDTEGHDLFVLQGCPWDVMHPRVLMVEFEDRKTELLGYTLRELAAYVTERGYHILISEWLPIVEYGRPHHWRRFSLHAEQIGHRSWGNLIAFRNPDDRSLFVKLARQTFGPLFFRRCAAEARVILSFRGRGPSLSTT